MPEMKSRGLQIFAVAVSLIAVTAASLQTYAGFSRTSVNTERVVRALIVLNQIGEIHTLLYEAETAVRGYALTRDPNVLDPYKRALVDLPKQIDELQRLTADNPAQLARLNELTRMMEIKRTQLAEAVSSTVKENPEIFKAARELTRRIRGLLSAMTIEEARSHALRSDELEKDTRTAILSLLGSVALSVLVIITVILMIILEAGRRVRTERQLQELNTQLEDRVASKTGELAKVNELLQAIIRSSPLGIVALDEHKVVTSWNRRAEEIFGLPAANILGTTWTLLSDIGGTNFKALFARVAGGELMHGISVTHQRGDGSRLHIVLAAAPLYQRPNRRRGVVLVIEDATERRMVEDQLRQAQKMEAVGQLTGGLAHDFNNLLAVIIGNLSLLDGSKAEAEQDAVDAALKAALRGAELTRQLLVFARQQSLQPADIKLEDLAGRTTALLRRSLGQSIAVEIRIPPDLWMAHADPSQVESALVNLALNARDAMPDGGQLTIELRNAEIDLDYVAQNPEVKPGQYVEMTVNDTGTGISPEILGRVFEPFFTTRPVGHGSGLGLSMVYGFAKQSGGHVKIHSEMGVGTTVRLLLPRARHGIELDRATSAIGSTGKGQTILVVEDHAEVREIVCKQLSTLGYGIIEAADGREALQVLADGATVDLLFTDVVMPGGMSGPELVAEARALRRNLRVLYTSGFPEASRNGGLCGTGDPLLSKPYRLQDLARRIASALKPDATTTTPMPFS